MKTTQNVFKYVETVKKDSIIFHSLLPQPQAQNEHFAALDAACGKTATQNERSSLDGECCLRRPVRNY